MIITPHWPIPLGHKPIDLGLERVHALLAALGNPHHTLPPVIHLAGTNGKGSTLAFTRAILEAAGYTTHSYISPHLVCFNERITLAGEMISDAYLYEILEECKAAAREIPVTFFEGTTVAALLAFSRIKADVVLLETGLGGRLDATNVIDHPALSIITPVSFDHTEFLGHSLHAIAGEKAGILKAGTPAIISQQEPEALTSIQAHAKAPLYVYGQEWQAAKIDNHLHYSEGDYRLISPLPNLFGDHQIINAGTAIAAIRHLKEFTVDETAILTGLQTAEHRARMQRLNDRPNGQEVWLDGGHNPSAGEALAHVAEQWNDQPLHLITAMLSGKDGKGFFAPLAGKVTSVTCITIPDDPNSKSAEDLAHEAKHVGIAAQTATSLDSALASIPATGRILICGSLYLAGHVLGRGL